LPDGWQIISETLGTQQYPASMTVQPIAEEPELLPVRVDGWLGSFAEYFRVSK
jgi:hypothetical protein